MKNCMIFITIASLSVSAAFVGGAGSDAKPGLDAKKISWHTDFAAAQEEARRENRPILAILH